MARPRPSIMWQWKQPGAGGMEEDPPARLGIARGGVEDLLPGGDVGFRRTIRQRLCRAARGPDRHPPDTRSRPSASFSCCGLVNVSRDRTQRTQGLVAQGRARIRRQLQQQIETAPSASPAKPPIASARTAASWSCVAGHGASSGSAPDRCRRSGIAPPRVATPAGDCRHRADLVQRESADGPPASCAGRWPWWRRSLAAHSCARAARR